MTRARVRSQYLAVCFTAYMTTTSIRTDSPSPQCTRLPRHPGRPSSSSSPILAATRGTDTPVVVVVQLRKCRLGAPAVLACSLRILGGSPPPIALTTQPRFRFRLRNTMPFTSTHLIIHMLNLVSLDEPWAPTCTDASVAYCTRARVPCAGAGSWMHGLCRTKLAGAVIL